MHLWSPIYKVFLIHFFNNALSFFDLYFFCSRYCFSFEQTKGFTKSDTKFPNFKQTWLTKATSYKGVGKTNCQTCFSYENLHLFVSCLFSVWIFFSTFILLKPIFNSISTSPRNSKNPQICKGVKNIGKIYDIGKYEKRKDF